MISFPLPWKTAALLAVLGIAVALVLPLSAAFGTAYVTVFNGTASHDVWKSKNMTSYGKFSRAKVTTGVSGCDDKPQGGCVYGSMKVPGVGTFSGLTPAYASFKYTTGTFSCRWSYPTGSNILRCYVGVPST